MSYHKRIILDFDDTLAFNENRDWANAKPNMKLIEKTNKLFDEGWTIDIFTARGSISCTTREEARQKYESGMKEWLNKHQVKHHSISFDKPLAAYYIDDKGMSPENFIEHDIRQLEGGLSGSDIYTDGNMVHKHDKNAHMVREWYNTVKGVNVPHVDRIVGETISMKYIKHDKDFFKNNIFVALGLIQETLMHLKNNKVQDELDFDSYRKRIEEHANNSSKVSLQLNANSLKNIKLKRSFSHGDFGITNMLFNDKKLYMIDPIPNVFGCLELDAAKFIASLYINKYSVDQINFAKRMMIAFTSIPAAHFNSLVAAEITRIYKYHPDKQFIMECFNNVFK